jgi:F-type H+-transporting ATPase subunit delta
MIESKVAVRYAKSVLGLAQEQSVLDAVSKDMLLVYKTIEASHDLKTMLNNPTIIADKKLAVLKLIFADKVNKLTISFLDIITRKRRESYLFDITYQFNELYKQFKGITTAVVTSAIKLDDKLRAEVISKVKQSANGEVELIEKVDATLIGGFVLRVGDRQYDTSVSRSLRRLTRDFSDNSYVTAY